ncbi:MAG: hypothetical protein AB7V58_15475 [Solirubrobacterales bacterium]
MASSPASGAWRRVGLGLAALVAALLSAGLARGEIAQQDGVRLSFDVQFRPQALPRDRPAPVSASFAGRISALDGGAPPRVRRLSIGFDRRGVVSTRGLPFCRRGDLQSVSTGAALARCGDALLGRGHFAAFIDFPPSGFTVRGPALAFNGRQGGRPVVLLHVYVSTPVRAALVIPMRISRPPQGRFGTVLSTKVPRLAGGAGYLTGIGLTLNRRYRSGGRIRSFVSASCPAPAGFTVDVFNLARGSFEFADGQRANVALSRTCRVRD